MITTFRKLQNYAKGKFFNREDEQDFVTFGITRKIGGSKATFPQLRIDFFRHLFGKPIHKDHEKKKALVKALPIDDMNAKYEFDYTFMHYQKIPWPYFTPKQAAIFVMIYFYGLQLTEVGKIFNLTTARIWQKHRDIIKILKKEWGESDVQ